MVHVRAKLRIAALVAEYTDTPQTLRADGRGVRAVAFEPVPEQKPCGPRQEQALWEEGGELCYQVMRPRWGNLSAARQAAVALRAGLYAQGGKNPIESFI